MKILYICYLTSIPAYFKFQILLENNYHFSYFSFCLWCWYIFCKINKRICAYIYIYIFFFFLISAFSVARLWPTSVPSSPLLTLPSDPVMAPPCDLNPSKAGGRDRGCVQMALQSRKEDVTI